MMGVVARVRMAGSSTREKRIDKILLGSLQPGARAAACRECATCVLSRRRRRSNIFVTHAGQSVTRSGRSASLPCSAFAARFAHKLQRFNRDAFLGALAHIVNRQGGN